MAGKKLSLGRESELTPAQRAANKRHQVAHEKQRLRLEAAAQAARKRKPGDRPALSVREQLAQGKTQKKKKKKPGTVKAKTRKVDPNRKRAPRKAHQKKGRNIKRDLLLRRENAREGAIQRKLAQLERQGRAQGGVADSSAMSKQDPREVAIQELFRQGRIDARAQNEVNKRR